MHHWQTKEVSLIQLNYPIQIETKKSPYTDAALIELNFTFLDTNENDRRIKLDMSPAVEKICVALDELLSLRDTGIEDFFVFSLEK